MKRLKMVLAEGLGKGTIYTIEKYTFYQGEGLAEGLAEGLSEGLTEGLRKKNDKECKKNDTRAREEKAPRCVPIPDELRRKIDKAIKGI